MLDYKSLSQFLLEQYISYSFIALLGIFWGLHLLSNILQLEYVLYSSEERLVWK